MVYELYLNKSIKKKTTTECLASSFLEYDFAYDQEMITAVHVPGFYLTHLNNKFTCHTNLYATVIF